MFKSGCYRPFRRPKKEQNVCETRTGEQTKEEDEEEVYLTYGNRDNDELRMFVDETFNCAVQIRRVPQLYVVMSGCRAAWNYYQMMN